MSFDFMGKKVIKKSPPDPAKNQIFLYGSMKERFTKKALVLTNSLWAYIWSHTSYQDGGRATLSTMESDGNASLINFVYYGDFPPLTKLNGLHVVIDVEGVYLHGTKIADRISSEKVVFIPQAVDSIFSEWTYRPDKHDDWGFIRDKAGNLTSRVITQANDELLTRHQENKTDPCEGLGRRLALFPEMAIELNRSFVGLCRQFGYVSVKEQYPGLVKMIEVLNGESGSQCQVRL